MNPLPRRLLVAALLLTPLAGVPACTAVPATPPVSGAATSTLPETPVVTAPPTGVSVERLGLAGPVIETGFAEGDGFEVPSLDDPGLASWFEPGPDPGQPGRAILLGHVDARGVPGVFVRVRELVPGDVVRVQLADGTELAFEVYATGQVPKSDYASTDLFDYRPGPELAIVTCGGELVRDADGHGRYEDNVTAYARLIEGTPQP